MEDIVYDCTGHYNESSKGCERSTGRQCEVEIWTCTSIGWLALICIYGLNDSITNLFDWMTLCWPSGGPLSWGQTNKYEGICEEETLLYLQHFERSELWGFGGLPSSIHNLPSNDKIHLTISVPPPSKKGTNQIKLRHVTLFFLLFLSLRI